MVGEKSLSSAALSQLITLRAEQGSVFSQSSEYALKRLLETLEDGLRGLLSSNFYLSSIDPGIGKTLAVCQFLKVWRERGFDPASSILVGVSRLEEIKTYLDQSGLLTDEIGVLTSDPIMNRLGVSSERHGNARVLFTTQQMIESRTRTRRFGDVNEFHYQGSPRTLRLWDETIVPAKPVVIKRDSLIALAEPLRPTEPAFIESLASFTKGLTEDRVGQSIRVSQELADQAPALRLGDPRRESISLEGQKALEDLRLAGRVEMALHNDPRLGLCLVGAVLQLPDDFMPCVILDASGRVRATYELWSKHRRNIVKLPPAANDYSPLTIRTWQTPCGKVGFATPSGRQHLLGPIAEVINEDTGKRWLLVHYKLRNDEFMQELRPLILSPDRVASLTWGCHHGTNAYRDFDNIILVGSSTYRTPDYPALAIAASGLPPQEADSIDLQGLRHGEQMHQILQAMCRSSVRNSSGGVSGSCNAYVIASRSLGLRERLQRTFPGAKVSVWIEPEQRFRGKAGKAFDYLLEKFADETVQEVPKREVRLFVGSSPKSFPTNVIRYPGFRDALTAEGINIETHYFRRVVCEFDPIDDDA